MPSHGALSKAGKVRSMTPKIESKKRRSSIPRVSNRKLYYKRFVLDRNSGQYKPNDRRRRRRRRR
ncbi:30S ribosomal protein S30e [Candidatus Bathyarchaeota archaeon]|nr:30S ribosomal protein S30e [Candidatus Bathyarchaeota archaeon]MCK4474650.1 30S ribosomal protein S30e [Candidatus Bathyarchaeota archaeon]